MIKQYYDDLLNWLKPFKVAVQISGFPRNFILDYPSFYTNILKPLNPDIYMHLLSEKPDHDPATIGMLGTYAEYIKGYEIEYRNPNNHKSDYIASKIKATNLTHPDTNIPAGCSMIYSREKANELRKNSGKKYDVVLMCRTEVDYGRKLTRDELELAKSGQVLIPAGYNHAGINDLFAVSNEFGADVFSTCYSSIQRLIFDKHVRFNQHTILLDRLTECNMSVERINFPLFLRKTQVT